MVDGAGRGKPDEKKAGKFGLGCGGRGVAGEEAGREGAEVAPPAGQLLLLVEEARYFLRVRR